MLPLPSVISFSCQRVAAARAVERSLHRGGAGSSARRGCLPDSNSLTGRPALGCGAAGGCFQRALLGLPLTKERGPLWLPPGGPFSSNRQPPSHPDNRQAPSHPESSRSPRSPLLQPVVRAESIEQVRPI